MPHIHELIDFTIAAYIVHKNKVLMIHHNALDQWLPIGGHIELHEDSDQALIREIKEETDLAEKDLVFIDNRAKIKSTVTKFLLVPQYMDLHDIKTKAGHKHLVMIYFVKSKTSNVKLKKDEHRQIRWFSLKELKKTKMRKAVRFYAIRALKILGSK